MLSLILFSFITYAQTTQTAEVAIAPMVSSVNTPDTPTYFFKPSPDGRYYAYASNNPRNSGGHKNTLLDSQSGTFLSIPGPYDPVFTLNLRNVVIPVNGGLSFYKLEDLISQQTNATPILVDKEMKGVYESVGKLSESPTEIQYRIMIENGGNRFYRDYKETIDAAGRTTSIAGIAPPKPLCTNYRFALPMISKDGSEFSGLDHDVGKSRVYKLKEDGTCDVIEELGFLTGKIAFSYNPRYLAFHVFDKIDGSSTFAFQFISTPSNTTTANIYIRDRQLNKTYKLTNYADGNAMYPEFLPDGDIVYLIHPHNKTDFSPRFVRIRPTIYE
jgi:hypothetical protein